ncbi:WcbI family polysaccharide biosynthesis putative acetyltransferase [Micrococcus terreus]|uniref:WcbI family polysaccharide biosynthesis putative acetyltransferase n=1 Tax=Micrococcus terreus TaxID=574650 RepID=UPI0023F89CFD|nr:WcbI family polysaccharide biosynthesis putative acetyltransferase [Micrococcus terreus]
MTTHTPPVDEGRRRHYGHFYGLEPLPAAQSSESGASGVLIVLGNCQAEALRQLITSRPDPALPPSVRIPPVFELTQEDLPHLQRLLAQTTVLVAQPVADDYRGMPLGTAQLAQLLPEGARQVRIPVLYDSGLFPWQVTVRHPDRPDEDPPVVPYHDLRTLAQAAAELGIEGVHGFGVQEGQAVPDDGPAPDEGEDTWGAPRLPLTAGTVQRLAADSLDRLRARESAHGTLTVTEELARLDEPGFHTINHPSNTVLALLAGKVRAELGADPSVAVPDRVMLGDVLAPIEQQILDGLGLEGPAREHWVVGGREVPDTEVRQAHLGWYRENPEAVRTGVQRHAELMRQLGLMA